MTTYFKLISGGTEFSDIEDANVVKKVGQTSAVSTFEATFPNRVGEHKTSFNVGDEIAIYLEKDVNPATIEIFGGVIEDIDFTGEGTPNERITISGRDFTALLQNTIVEPTVYTNQEISVIVADLVSNFCPTITTVNVAVTTITLTRQSFSNISVFDAIKHLANLAGFEFWVDVDKDLHFVAKGITSSGYTLNSTNVLKSSFKNSTDGMANEVWVYGDKQLVGFRESFACDGGSLFTLQYKPHNTEVFVAGSTVPSRLGIYQMVSFNPSGVDAMVSYDDKQIIFVSGADIGNSIPSSGGSIVVNYDRDRTIIKYGANRGSIDVYGRYSKTIVDNNIKDPQQAKDLLKAELEENSMPKKQGKLRLRTIVNLNAGESVIVNLPYSNINNQLYNMLEVNYKITKESLLSDDIITVTVNDKVNDVIDTIKQVILDIKKLQAKETQTTDILTRLETSIGSVSVRVKTWKVTTKGIGNSFILGHPINGILGSPALGVNGSQILLGDYRTGSTFWYSGGEVI